MSYSVQSTEIYGNDPSVEAMWAMKAYEHAQIYFNVLCSVDAKLLKLTPHDDLIYEDFYKCFPGLNLKLLNIDDLKNAAAKQKWRRFCTAFEDVVEDFNFGTLLRIDADLGYTEENTILVTRIQFYAVEIARNRKGLNDHIRQNFKTIDPKAFGCTRFFGKGEAIKMSLGAFDIALQDCLTFYLVFQRVIHKSFSSGISWINVTAPYFCKLLKSKGHQQADRKNPSFAEAYSGCCMQHLVGLHRRLWTFPSIVLHPQGYAGVMFAMSAIVDKGWSWIVLLAVSFSNVIIAMQYCSSSIFYTTFLQVFQESRAFTSWFVSLNSTLLFCFGPLASYLLPKIGIRNVIFVGAGCTALSYVILATSASLTVIILAYGIFAGIGLGFALTGGVSAIATYFDRHLFRASSISLFGGGVGTLIHGPLLEWLILEYGWRSASLLYSGISLQMCIAAATVFSMPVQGQAHREPSSHQEKLTECGTTVELQRLPMAVEDPCVDGHSSSTLAVDDHFSFSDSRFWCISYVGFTWGFCACTFVGIIKDVIVSAGLVEHFQVAVVASGMANSLSRIFVSFLNFDSVLLGFLFVLLLGGITIPIYVAIFDYWTLMIVSILSGLYLGSSFVMLPMSVGAIYGRQKMATIYGYVVFFVGISNLGGPSLIGYLRDVTGVYITSLYLLGAVQVTGAVLVGFLHFRMKYRQVVK